MKKLWIFMRKVLMIHLISVSALASNVRAEWSMPNSYIDHVESENTILNFYHKLYSPDIAPVFKREITVLKSKDGKFVAFCCYVHCGGVHESLYLYEKVGGVWELRMINRGLNSTCDNIKRVGDQVRISASWMDLEDIVVYVKNKKK